MAMGNPLAESVRRVAYGAAQTAKIGWYTLQYVGARHISGPLNPPGHVPKPYRSVPPSGDAFRDEFLSLMRREADDIANGVYRMPRDLREFPNPLRLLDQARRYRDEARVITRRAHAEGGAVEVRDASGASYPTYYLQNFHFQTGGWLSDDSADVYDTQVEALFTGLADAMRRRALPVILSALDRATSHQRHPVFADIASGTGRLLADVIDNRADIDALAIDLSTSYLKRARERVGKEAAAYVSAPAEKLPLPDNSVDVLTSVYLFHELPPKIRREVAREFARVVRPGGSYVHVDSIQYGDTEMDIMLEGFPRAVHEPYYDGYCREDLAALFAEAGWEARGSEVAFLTKVSEFRLPSS